MIIVLNRVRHRGIVVIPLLSVYFSHIVLIIEVLQEQGKHLLLTHLRTDHLRVLRAVVDLSNFSHINAPCSLLVEFQKGLVNDGLSSTVWFTSNCGEEVGEVDYPIVVFFEKGEDDILVGFREVNSAFAEAK